MRCKAVLTLALGAAAISAGASAADPGPQAIGMSVGSLGNPFFVATVKGAQAEAKKLNPDARVTAVSADYDLNKQFTQVDNFIAAGDRLILLNAVDPVGVLPAVKKAEAAGAVVAAFDVAAQGATVTAMTNNLKAGQIACQYLAEKIGGKGNVVIINGPPVSSVIDRVKGCKEMLAKSPGIKVVSDNLNADGKREGGFEKMQGLLTRFPEIAGVFAINDPTAIGADLAAKQLNRHEMVITSVDGAPDIESALKQPGSLIVASASQDPYEIAVTATRLGAEVLAGHKPAQTTVLLDPQLITRENVGQYKGWQAPR
jgi:ribose transport system substrate-binding protein